MKGTICDRCGKICKQNIFQVEAWKINEDGAREGAWTFRSDLCQSCYDDINSRVHQAPAQEAVAYGGSRR
jgi:hypothetical protein